MKGPLVSKLTNPSAMNQRSKAKRKKQFKVSKPLTSFENKKPRFICRTLSEAPVKIKESPIIEEIKDNDKDKEEKQESNEQQMQNAVIKPPHIFPPIIIHPSFQDKIDVWAYIQDMKRYEEIAAGYDTDDREFYLISKDEYLKSVHEKYENIGNSCYQIKSIVKDNY